MVFLFNLRLKIKEFFANKNDGVYYYNDRFAKGIWYNMYVRLREEPPTTKIKIKGSEREKL